MDIELSVVVPVHNEQDNVVPLIEEIQAALGSAEAAESFEMLFIDDFSADSTKDVLEGAKERTKLAERSKNQKELRRAYAELKDSIEELNKAKAKDAEQIKELKGQVRISFYFVNLLLISYSPFQLKKAQNDHREMKLLLDMYKTCTKEQREKAQIMVNEKKTRAELEDVSFCFYM